MTHGQLNTEQWGPHRALPLPSSLRDPAQGSLSWKWLPTIRAGGGARTSVQGVPLEESGFQD